MKYCLARLSAKKNVGIIEYNYMSPCMVCITAFDSLAKQRLNPEWMHESIGLKLANMGE